MVGDSCILDLTDGSPSGSLLIGEHIFASVLYLIFDASCNVSFKIFAVFGIKNEMQVPG